MLRMWHASLDGDVNFDIRHLYVIAACAIWRLVSCSSTKYNSAGLFFSRTGNGICEYLRPNSLRPPVAKRIDWIEKADASIVNVRTARTIRWTEAGDRPHLDGNFNCARSPVIGCVRLTYSSRLQIMNYPDAYAPPENVQRRRYFTVGKSIYPGLAWYSGGCFLFSEFVV